MSAPGATMSRALLHIEWYDEPTTMLGIIANHSVAELLLTVELIPPSFALILPGERQSASVTGQPI